MARAGNRCEHHYLHRWRCPDSTTLEADHVHPHSRGGSTTVGNSQVLCKRHNSLKGARIPFTWELRRLATLRRGYFPPGVDPAVVRRGAAPTTKGERPHPGRQRPAAAVPDASNVAWPAIRPESIAPEIVLTMWAAVYPVDLTPQQHEAFLTHAAMPAVTAHDRAVIEGEMRHHQKLDDLAHALEARCHYRADAQPEDQAVAGQD